MPRLDQPIATKIASPADLLLELKSEQRHQRKPAVPVEPANTDKFEALLPERAQEATGRATKRKIIPAAERPDRAQHTKPTDKPRDNRQENADLPAQATERLDEKDNVTAHEQQPRHNTHKSKHQEEAGTDAFVPHAPELAAQTTTTTPLELEESASSTQQVASTELTEAALSLNEESAEGTDITTGSGASPSSQNATTQEQEPLLATFVAQLAANEAGDDTMIVGQNADAAIPPIDATKNLEESLPQGQAKTADASATQQTSATGTSPLADSDNNSTIDTVEASLLPEQALVASGKKNNDLTKSLAAPDENSTNALPTTDTKTDTKPQLDTLQKTEQPKTAEATAAQLKPADKQKVVEAKTELTSLKAEGTQTSSSHNGHNVSVVGDGQKPQQTSLQFQTTLTATLVRQNIALERLPYEIMAGIRNGAREIEIRLDPAELGRIDVKLDIDKNGGVTTHLIVERPETLDQLRRDSQNLEKALQQSGLKADSGSLQFSLRDQQQQPQGQEPGFQNRRSGVAELRLEEINSWAHIPARANLGEGRGSGIDRTI